MEKLKQYKYIILIALIVLGGSFYWYEFRPSYIKKACHTEAAEAAEKLLKTKAEMYYRYEKTAEKNMYLGSDYDAYYKRCLQKKGL